MGHYPVHKSVGAELNPSAAEPIRRTCQPVIKHTCVSLRANSLQLDLRAASTIMQYQIITTGQRIWTVGVAVGLFECYVLSEKTALDTARAPLLAEIQSTGKIYAR